LIATLLIILSIPSLSYANETLKFEQRSFVGGLNTETNANLIDNAETPDCLNVLPYENIGIKTRDGYVPYLDSFVCDLWEAFDSTTGLIDSTGLNDIDLTNFEGTQNATISSSGKWGSCLYVPTQNDNVTANHGDGDSADNFQILADHDETWTIDFWIKHDNTDGGQTYMALFDGNDTYYRVGTTTNGLYFQFEVTADTFPINILVDAAKITDTDWHHIAICKVADGAGNVDWGLYKDGDQVGYSDSTYEKTFNAVSYFIVGGRSTGHSEFFDGLVDEVRVTNSNPFNASPVVGVTDSISVPSSEYSVGVDDTFLAHFENMPWFTSTDGANLTLDTSEYREGTSSLQFDKTGTSESFASIYRSCGWDLSSYEAGDKYVLVYIPSAALSDVASVEVIFESSTNNYVTYTFSSGLTSGWQKLTMVDGDEVETGTMDWSSVTEETYKINTNAAGDTFDDIAFDCFMASPDTAYVIRGLHKYVKSQGDEYILCAANTNIYKADVTLGLWIPIYDELSANKNVEFLTANQLCYIVNGFDENIKFDGTEITKMGIIAPSAPPTLNAETTGDLVAGSYSWVYTYYNSESGHESDPSLSYSKDVTDGQGITLNITESLDDQVDRIRIYRTVVNGAIYLLEEEITSTTTYTSDATDTLLGLPVETDNAPPPILRGLAYHKGRVVGWGNPENKSYVYFSNIDEPESWDDEDIRDVGTRDGYNINGIYTFLDYVLVFKERNHIYVLDDVTFADISSVNIIKANTDRGCGAYRSIAQIKNFIMFMTDQNTVESYVAADPDTVYKYDMLQTIDVSEKIKGQIKDISTDICAAAVFDDCYILSSPTKNMVLYYDFDLKSWWRMDNMRVYKFLKDGDTLYGAFNDGKVYKLFVGETDDGTAVTSYWKSKQFDIELPNNWKRVRRLYLNFAGEIRGDVDVTYYKDYSLAATTEAISLASSTSFWGTFDWAEEDWAGTPVAVQGRVIMKGRCKVVQIMLKNTDINEQFKLYGLELFYIPKGYYNW